MRRDKFPMLGPSIRLYFGLMGSITAGFEICFLLESAGLVWDSIPFLTL